jgi:hypothetical protein
MNDQPQVRMRLMVTAPGHGTYEKTVKEYVPPAGSAARPRPDHDGPGQAVALI